MRKRIFLIDGNNLYCRGYFVARSQGKNILGFILKMVMNIKKMQPASRVVFAFDTTKSERRLALYPEYKENRKSSMTEEEHLLFTQMNDAFIEIIRKTGCTVMDGNGYEADDYIATFAHMLNVGYDVVIVSTDNDLYQLVNENNRVYDPIKSIFVSLENFTQITGIPKERFLDYKCMLGDKSDNIPGFEGVGEVSAKKYIDAYGSYDDIAKAIEAKPEKDRKKKDVTLLDRKVYTRNKELVDLSVNYTDRRLKLLVKGFVDATKFDEKELHTILATYDLSNYYYPMKALRLTESVL